MTFCRGQKRVPKSLELELQVIVRHLIGVMGNMSDGNQIQFLYKSSKWP